MRKVLTFLSASLCLAWVAGTASAQTAPDMFKDVPTDHWAYQAVENLRAKGILIGYPDEYFRGKRTLTRYEFAVALDRLLQKVTGGEAGVAGPKGDTGPAGPAGPEGPKGDQGPAGVRPEELDAIRRLTAEFRDELARLGNNIAAINRRLDGLAKDVADLRTRIDNMPVIYGGAYVAIRADRVDGRYVDRDGRPNGIGTIAGSTLTNTPVIVHQLALGVKANIRGGATLDAMLTSNNTKNYGGGNSAQLGPLNVNPAADTYIHHLEVSAPLGGIGSGSKITLGRFGHNVSRLTLWKPDTDRYFMNPFEDDGKYYMDGVRGTGKFGSITAEVYASQTKSVAGTNGPLGINSPLAGAPTGAASTAIFAGGFKPAGQRFVGQMTVDQLIGLTLGLGLRQLQGGHIRLHAIDTSARLPGNAGAGFGNTWIFGADVDLKLMDRITLTADWAKTNTHLSRLNTLNASNNNAFNANVGFKSGGFNAVAGYRYIDPLYYAPGYWGWIGNWLNPTNIQGPTFRAGYDFSPAFGLNIGGDFFSGARNRGPAGLTTNDDIHRLLVGLRWDVSKNFRTTVDWEGVYWKLTNARFGGGGRVNPTEHYVTLGTGYNLTDQTQIKLGYQLGMYDGHGALGSAAGTKYTFNTFTSQVAVKF